MISNAKTKAKSAKDSTTPIATKHFPNIAGCFAEACIADAAHFPWNIADTIIATPEASPIPIPDSGDNDPDTILLLRRIIRIKPYIDCDDGVADMPMNLPCPSSTRLITPCDAIPAIPHPTALPRQLSPNASAGPIILKSITVFSYFISF